jgi:hypothetical protein
MLATASYANVYTLDQSECCGTGPFGTVTVTQTVADQLNFSIVLNAGYAFHGTNSPQHHALTFSLAGNPTITISGLAAPFTGNGAQAAGTRSSAPFGSFDYVINFPHAPNQPHPTSLSFVAQAAGLTLASLEPGSKGAWFAVDITNNGNTGNVAAIPEPGTYALLLSGLGVIALIARRRRTGF